ncbi:MAG: hypothetical protein ACT4OJ_05990 [Bacteroidota bacterium]
MATTEMIVLSFNDKEWIAEKYYPIYKTKGRKVISTSMTKMVKKDSAAQFHSLFDSLIMNQLFLIDDEHEVRKRMPDQIVAISDGVLYTISFKVGDQFRRYWYDNPETHIKYSKAPEYKQVVEIIRLITSIF